MDVRPAAGLRADYDRFLKRVRETRLVWGLKSSRGWAMCPSCDRASYVLPFWSGETCATHHCVNEWTSYRPASIPLDEFVDSWLGAMHSDGALVGVDFNAGVTGLEIEPLSLAKALSDDP